MLSSYESKLTSEMGKLHEFSLKMILDMMDAFEKQGITEETLNSPDGQLMSYKLHHRRTGSQLLDNQTMAQANVLDGDELRLQPEITAGCRGAA